MKTVLCALIVFVFRVSASDDFLLNTKPFPNDFKFGVSTAAYQIEGGWDEDGKGPSMWDEFVHVKPSVVIDNSTGDVACDSYHRYEEDIALLKKMGAQFYRFSISWPRILPYGTSNKVNDKGVEYYLNILKALKENGIEPIVTLYHWDLPKPLNDMGGWTNPDIVHYFGDYARVCYEKFGSYVKYWVTINEPQTTCFLGYGGPKYPMITTAPGYDLAAEGVYLCAYTHVKAHALAYHIYQDEFKATQNGTLSLSLVSTWLEPATNDSTDDQLAQELGLQFYMGLFAHPIFVGNWPQLVIDRVGNRSQLEGLPESRLRAFTEEEIKYINGTYDWYSLNYYNAYLATLAYREDELPGNASFTIDQGYTVHSDESWKASSSSPWLVQTPWGLTNVLKWVHDNYNQPEIIITENGWSDDGTSLNDTERIEYVGRHLSSILDAIYDHNVSVTGYTHWSLLDNFEWTNGYTCKFGMVSVDFNDKNRTRTPKQSFYWYKDVISARCKFGMVSVDFNDKNRTRTPKQSFYWYKDVISARSLTSGAIAAIMNISLLKLILTIVVTHVIRQLV